MEIIPLGGSFGVEVCGLDVADPDIVGDCDLMRDLVARHGLLLVRGQSLDGEAHARVCGLLGELQGPAGASAGQGPRWHHVANRPVEGEAVLPYGPVEFHFDACFRAQPRPFMSLYAVEAPSADGETLFADGAAAWDALDAATQAELLACTATHTYHRGAVARAENLALPDQVSHDYPVAIRDLTGGRTVLYVCRMMTARLHGMSPARSDSLLVRLFDHMEEPRFVHAHAWRAGDLVLWDNMRLAHARNTFDPAEPRVLRRIMIGTRIPEAASLALGS